MSFWKRTLTVATLFAAISIPALAFDDSWRREQREWQRQQQEWARQARQQKSEWRREAQQWKREMKRDAERWKREFRRDLKHKFRWRDGSVAYI